ncbi:MAG TPA: hypothetical protein VFL83_02190 [Anaeromyxobacter sp.]|nr:hypothetical protein [Anaeromyxobacter sp.]
MAFAAAAALLALALGGIDGTAVALQASGRTETSALAFSGGGGGTRGLAALDVLPRLGLLLDRKTLRLALAYEPQLRASQALSYAAGDVALVHGGSARAEWDLHPLWRATGTARSSVRILDFVAAGAGDLGRLLDLRRAPSVFRYRDDGATAAIEGRPTPLVTVGSTASVAWSGGAGAFGAAAVPWMREARVAGSVARAQTRRDVLRLEAAGAAAAFELGEPASLATVSAEWSRQVRRALRLRLVGSASEARDRTSGGRLLGGGEAGLEATPALLGRPLALSASLRAGPAFDRFVARVQERAGADAAATWAVTPRWSVGASAAYARVRERLGYAAGRGAVRGEWKATRRLVAYADAWHEQRRDPAALAGGSASYLGVSVGVILAPVAR